MNDFPTALQPTPGHPPVDRVPSGFSLANEQQVAAFIATGSVDGASKVTVVARGGSEFDLAIRLRPPRQISHIKSNLGRNSVPNVERYIAEYNAGWAASKRPYSAAWDSGNTSHAWDDGYLDYAAGRTKWHLTYCADHDNCGEG